MDNINKRHNNQALYHNPAFRELVGDVLHPGGLSLTEYFVKMCNWPLKANVADVGCGAGATLKMLKELGYSPLGFDIDPAMVMEAAYKSGAKITLAPADKLPLESGALDGIICECVLSLTDKPAAVLEEFYRVLSDGAYLIFSDIAVVGTIMESMDDAMLQCSGAVTMASSTKRLQAAGFSVVKKFESQEAIKRLAAQMLWAGIDDRCSSNLNFFSGHKLTYASWLAKKN